MPSCKTSRMVLPYNCISAVYAHWIYRLDTCIRFIFIYLHLHTYTHVIRVSHQYISCGSAHFFLFPPPGLLNTADLLEKISQLQVGQLKMAAILYGVSLDFLHWPKAETLLFLKKVAEKSSADLNQAVGFCRNLWSFEFSLWKNLSCPEFTSGHVSIKVQTLCRKPSLCTEELDVLVKRGEHIYAWIMTYSVAAFRRKHATHPACPCRRWFSWMKTKTVKFFNWLGFWKPRHRKEKSCQILFFYIFYRLFMIVLIPEQAEIVEHCSTYFPD